MPFPPSFLRCLFASVALVPYSPPLPRCLGASFKRGVFTLAQPSPAQYLAADSGQEAAPGMEIDGTILEQKLETMYQAIITETFRQLLQHQQGSLESHRAAGTVADPLLDLIQQGIVHLEPVFPGSTDAQLRRHYKVSLSHQLSPAEIEQVRSNPAFESFYEKPADELPM